MSNHADSATPAPSTHNRREFLHRAGAAAGGLGLGLSLSPRAHAQSPGANSRVRLGLIGCGNMGRQNLSEFLKVPGVEVVAVCDVDDEHRDHAAADVAKANQPAPAKHKDFRRLLEQKDLDAVAIATPDHWHAPIFIAACEAGKDIYCEKPISHSFVEAKAMLNAALHFKRVVQVGTWQRTSHHFKVAMDFIRSGKLGKINVCRAWKFDTNFKDIGRQQPQKPPAGLDWNFWLGPSPLRDYQPNRCHVHWRWFQDTGGSMMSDWGVHMIDIVLLAMKESDPVTVAAAGGKWTCTDDRDTPDTMQAVYRFPQWLLHWEQRFNNSRGLDGGEDHGAEFIGDQGTLIVDRYRYQYHPATSDGEEPPPSESGISGHWTNFIDCVRSRAKPASDIESMAKTTMVCLLGNLAWQSGQTLRWDAARQDITNGDDVKQCAYYQRPYRKPWELKLYKV